MAVISFRTFMHTVVLVACCTTIAAMGQESAASAQDRTVAPNAADSKRLDLSTSKTLSTAVIGEPQRVGSFPVNVTLSPDGRYLAILDDGFGWVENDGRQGIGIVDRQTNRVAFFPDDRLGKKARQTYFVGIAFSSDGAHIYASIASLTDPLAEKEGSTGNGIAVYRFAQGQVTPERFLRIAPPQMAPGKRVAAALSAAPKGTAIPYPAGLAVVKSAGGEKLLVADNLSDDVLLLDAASGQVAHRFDLSTSNEIPGSYPYSLVANRAGTRAWCSLWNASRVAELNLTNGKVRRWISLRRPKSATDAGSHPSALMLSPDESALLVALSNRDQVAIVNANTGRVERFLSTLLPNQEFPGTYPNALAQTSDGAQIFVANASSNSVAVFRRAPGTRRGLRNIASTYKLQGFIPTEWYPTALAVDKGDLLIATGKAQGPGANSAILPKEAGNARSQHPYVASLMHGSIARVKIADALADMQSLTREVAESNRMNGRSGDLDFKPEACGKPANENARCNPIKHVIYVIKENRTYDQLFGDLGVGDGDPSLVMYGEEITPNHHKLALQFGVLDNFYDSGEVSGNGHVWSMAAITSDYTEKTWPVGYRGNERSYDYEGRVQDETPLEQGIPDVNEPGSGYLWSNAARRGISYRHYGEYVMTQWCDDPENANPQVTGTPVAPGQQCATKFVRQGDLLPQYLGEPRGGPSPWPWEVPILARNVATKPELRDHFDDRFADFRMEFPDQLRADEFLNELREFVLKRQAGADTMPNLIVLRLPNDHTSGTRPGKATPAAAVADNDLALGRVVDAVSHSAYWDDTAIFVLEDDAQDGADHVDAHRSIALVISKYAPLAAQPVVHHEFYTTVNVIHTMESLLGLPPMNNNDAQAPLIAPAFSGGGEQPAFSADYRNRDNGLLYRVNAAKAPGAKASLEMDFRHADAVDTEALNRILWREARGDAPMPEPRHNVIPAR